MSNTLAAANVAAECLRTEKEMSKQRRGEKRKGDMINLNPEEDWAWQSAAIISSTREVMFSLRLVFVCTGQDLCHAPQL